MKEVFGQHCQWINKKGYSEHGSFVRKTLCGNYIFQVHGHGIHALKVIKRYDSSLEWFRDIRKL